MKILILSYFYWFHLTYGMHDSPIFVCPASDRSSDETWPKADICIYLLGTCVGGPNIAFLVVISSFYLFLYFHVSSFLSVHMQILGCSLYCIAYFTKVLAFHWIIIGFWLFLTGLESDYSGAVSSVSTEDSGWVITGWLSSQFILQTSWNEGLKSQFWFLFWTLVILKASTCFSLVSEFWFQLQCI